MGDYTIEKKELTLKERSTWGTCKVCGAPQGKKCKDSLIAPIKDGVHTGRLQNAPRYSITTFHS